MICISVAPESRKLAKVDILNASMYADLVEVCLDKLIKTPDVGDMISGFDKPILVSCRRQQDGGHFKGTEEERQQLLRSAIVAGPDYIELELDIAKKIPRFGKTQRVISYTSINEPLSKIDDIFEEAYKANADVVKFTWPTPTLDAAWPLLAAVHQKREVPVVGMGLGTASVTFSLLGRKYGAPWIYAALEQGMEAHDGQATVWDLNENYAWSEIDAETRFIGLLGLGHVQSTTTRILNTAFQECGLKWRCLPMEFGRTEKLGPMLDKLKINALLVSPQRAERIIPFVQHAEPAARDSGYADLVFRRDDGWHGYNTVWRSVLKAVEDVLGRKDPEDRPLDKRNVLIIGAGGAAQAVAHGIKKRKGILSLAAPDDEDARQTAQLIGARFVSYAQLYDTLCDVVIITDPNAKMGHRKEELNPSFLRESMTVLDISRYPDDSPFFEEARQRGSRAVDPALIYADQLTSQFKAVTGQDMPPGVIENVLSGK